jgi:hypothetical protein
MNPSQNPPFRLTRGTRIDTLQQCSCNETNPETFCPQNALPLAQRIQQDLGLELMREEDLLLERDYVESLPATTSQKLHNPSSKKVDARPQKTSISMKP